MINFLLNDQQISIENLPADTTLLDFLRDNKGLCGTKEGCASGDCGACTIAIASPNKKGNDLEYKAVNSCITLLSAVQGKHVISVEHLQEGENLHPVQQAMVDHHGSQCGFCTPGFVMSLFCLYQKNSSTTRQQVQTALSGNLCRCTGYRPIIDAALASCQPHQNDQFAQRTQQTLDELNNMQSQQAVHMNGLMLPRTRQQLQQCVQSEPNALFVAGSTDLALQSTQQYVDLGSLISVSHVPELNRIEDSQESLLIGAALPFSDFEAALLSSFPELAELVERFASLPIRNQATLGGNVANASPIGDMPPVLLALGAQINIDNGSELRVVNASEFFLDYRKTALQTGEWIDSILLPKTQHNGLRAYKVSKRIEDDISAVCAVFKLTLQDGKVSHLNTGFGGVAAIPTQCEALQQSMLGRTWSDKQVVEDGMAILYDAFSPIDDVRASASYRKQILANLWKRFWLETQSHDNHIETRVIQHA